MRRLAVLIGAAAFLLSLGTRLANAPAVFAGEVPRISVLDDLYHLKRMASVPRLIDFDPDRGERGAFCPWPPLYDVSAGALARISGATSAVDVLRRVIWIPPLVSALFIALVAAVLTQRLGWEAGAAFAVATALSPLLIAESSLGNIDHHFLEAPLVFGIIAAATLAVGRWQLAVALVAAMFVQTALVLAVGLAFVVLFVWPPALSRRDGRLRAGHYTAFTAAAAVIALYRLTRPPGYPNSEWFLGWPHVALFAAAAVALFFRSRALGLIFGALLALAALPQMLQGLHFLGGDPWLRTIVEFRPIWRAQGDDVLSLALAMGVGSILVWPLALKKHPVALFAIVYLVLTLTSRRFCLIAIPLVVLAATIYAASLPARLRRLALVAMVAPVVVHFAMSRNAPLAPIVDEREEPWVRAAAFLRDRPGPGRVLAPWSMGHAIDVLGARPVIVDPFGTMADQIVFDRAHDAFLAHDEEALARYCDGAGVRYVVLENPVYGLQGAAASIGLDPRQFMATRLAASTWWWRAYYGRLKPAAARFRLVYADPQPSWRGTPVLRGPALEIWERDP